MTYVLMHNSAPIFATDAKVEAESAAVARVLVVDMFETDPRDDHEVLVEWSPSGKLFVLNDTGVIDQGTQRFTGYEVRKVANA